MSLLSYDEWLKVKIGSCRFSPVGQGVNECFGRCDFQVSLQPLGFCPFLNMIYMNTEHVFAEQTNKENKMWENFSRCKYITGKVNNLVECQNRVRFGDFRCACVLGKGLVWRL